jgi:lipopolysaccharide heptosyltransferase II
MKALVVGPSPLGDVIYALPLLEVMRRCGYEVTWLAEPQCAPFLERVSLLSRVVPAPATVRLGTLRGVVRTLRSEGFDVAVDLEGRWRSAAWARVSNARRIIGHAGPWRTDPLSSALLREPVDVPEEAHHDIDRNLALLRLLGIDTPPLREFPLPATEKERPGVEAFLESAGVSEFVVICPGGEFPSRLWGVQGFAQVSRDLRERSVSSLVFWTKGEERLAERLVGASEGAAKLCPPLSLFGFMELARRARLVVAADSGPLHLACAMGVPVVAIYGPTNPGRNGPFDPRDAVVRRTPLCSPCYKRRCPIHDGVMDAITSQDVLGAIERRLAGTLERSLAV